MPRHKDIRSLETFPASTTQWREETCLDLLPLRQPSSLYLSETSQKSSQGQISFNRHVTVGLFTKRSALLSFDWRTLNFSGWRASTHHSIKSSSPPSSVTGMSFWGRKLLTSPPSLRWRRKRRDFLSVLSPSVSFITSVVISRSWDFFLLSALWKVDKRPLCLLTPLFPFNKLCSLREETLRQPPSQKESW